MTTETTRPRGGPAQIVPDGAGSAAPPSAGPDPATPPHTRHLGLALVVISAAQLMLVLDELIVNTALPHIQRALGFSGTGLEWIVTGYAITFGGLLMLGGRSGDVLGRRRMFIAGVTAFALASLLGGLATTAWWLIASRAVQGAAAAVAAPAALSLIAVTFPEGAQRNRALGVYAAMTGMGGAVGVIAGGLLTTYASWRWVFFVNVPIGLLLAAGARYVIPETQRHPRHLDLPGAITGTAGFALLVYGLTRAATGPDGVSHWGDPATVASLAGAAVALIAFVLIEARTREPLLPLRIFADRTRAGVYLILLCLASAFFGLFFFLTQFLQVVWGYSPLKGGLAYLPFIGAFIVVAGISSKLVTRLGARPLMTAGAVIAPVGLFWLSRVHEGSQYLTRGSPAADRVRGGGRPDLRAAHDDACRGRVGRGLGRRLQHVQRRPAGRWLAGARRHRQRRLDRGQQPAALRGPSGLRPRAVIRGHRRDGDRCLRGRARPGDHARRDQGPPRGPARRPGGHVTRRRCPARHGPQTPWLARRDGRASQGGNARDGVSRPCRCKGC